MTGRFVYGMQRQEAASIYLRRILHFFGSDEAVVPISCRLQKVTSRQDLTLFCTAIKASSFEKKGKLSNLSTLLLGT
jgi:hypothetical protein